MNGGTTPTTIDGKLVQPANMLTSGDFCRIRECIDYRIDDLESKQRHRVDQSRTREIMKLCELKTRLERAL
jgi:hypothetical protein